MEIVSIKRSPMDLFNLTISLRPQQRRVEQTLNCSGGSMVISACKATKAGGAIFLKSAHVTGWPEGVMMQC